MLETRVKGQVEGISNRVDHNYENLSEGLENLQKLQGYTNLDLEVSGQ